MAATRDVVRRAWVGCFVNTYALGRGMWVALQAFSEQCTRAAMFFFSSLLFTGIRAKRSHWVRARRPAGEVSVHQKHSGHSVRRPSTAQRPRSRGICGWAAERMSMVGLPPVPLPRPGACPCFCRCLAAMATRANRRATAWLRLRLRLSSRCPGAGGSPRAMASSTSATPCSKEIALHILAGGRHPSFYREPRGVLGIPSKNTAL